MEEFVPVDVMMDDGFPEFGGAAQFSVLYKEEWSADASAVGVYMYFFLFVVEGDRGVDIDSLVGSSEIAEDMGESYAIFHHGHPGAIDEYLTVDADVAVVDIRDIICSVIFD